MSTCFTSAADVNIQNLRGGGGDIPKFVQTSTLTIWHSTAIWIRKICSDKQIQISRRATKNVILGLRNRNRRPFRDENAIKTVNSLNTELTSNLKLTSSPFALAENLHYIYGTHTHTHSSSNRSYIKIKIAIRGNNVAVLHLRKEHKT